MKTLGAVALGVQVTSVAIALLAPSLGVAPELLLSILTSILLVCLLKRSAQEKIVPNVDAIIEEQVAQRTDTLIKKMTHFEKQAATDALTGLLNRRGGEEAIHQQIERCRSSGKAFSFILIDIDHFKLVNDRFGHAAGDTVISGVSNAIKENLRASDFAIRWGGEEYLACLPDTDLAGAMLAAEKLRQVVEKLDFDMTPVTVSLGCAELGEDPFNVALARADMHLYFAKSKGRNQVFPNFSQKSVDRS